MAIFAILSIFFTGSNRISSESHLRCQFVEQSRHHGAITSEVMRGSVLVVRPVSEEDSLS